MEPKTVRPQAKEIQKRFFEALSALKDIGRIKSLQYFCNEYGLHRPKYQRLKTQKENPNRVSAYKFIDIDALAYLARDYGVSTEWLLLGSGKMFIK